MVEPQEPSTFAKLLKNQQKFTYQTIKDGKDLPDEMVTIAEKKLAGFNRLKEEIDWDLASAQKKLEGVRKKIRENTWSVDNRDGLLTAKQEDYL